MRSSRVALTLLGHLLTSTAQYTQPTERFSPTETTGFSGPVSKSYSHGKHAVCVSGNVAVTVNAANVDIVYSEPTNQSVVTEFFQELTQVNSTLIARTTGGSSVIKATFNIDTTLCFPINQAESTNITAVQVLLHGTGLDKSYWDIASGYSYVDAAASNGYATLAYNRLGCGASDHPDPIQVVQAATDVEIQHELVQLLRAGKLGGLTPSHIITVGHSYGSTLIQGQNTKYPQDADASVVTGFASNFAYLGTTFVANNPSIAALNNPSKFAGLPYGYVVHNDAISYQLPFFRFPYFDPSIFENQLAAKQPYTIGIELTNGAIVTPAPNFTGPVDIVLGQHDYAFCLGMCEDELLAATIALMYPAASPKSETYIVPNSGHCINAHYSAQQAFKQINGFLKRNSL